MRLLLASKSMTRRQMLEAAGVPFELCDTSFNEDSAKAELRARPCSAPDLAAALAEAKTRAVSAVPGDLVLGADQTLEMHDGSMLDKPRSLEDSFAQLKALSGRTHRLHSAAAISRGGSVRWRHTQSVTLHVRDLSDEFLREYLAREYDSVRFNVGGYRIEGPGVQLFSRIEGSHFAILGLPLLPLLDYLRGQGVLKT